MLLFWMVWWLMIQQIRVIRTLNGVRRFVCLGFGSHENYSNIDHGSEHDTTTYTHTKRSKVSYRQTDTESNTQYTNSWGHTSEVD